VATQSQTVAENIPDRTISYRRFGIDEADLAIDFARSDTPGLITRLLEACVCDPQGKLPTGYFRELSIGKRLECLLILAAGPEGAPLDFPFQCSECGEKLELEVTLDEITALQQQADLIGAIEIDWKGQKASFRKPSGRDQEGWARTIFQDEHEAAAAMVRGLKIGGFEGETMDSTAFELVEKALDEADPLVNFLCRVACDVCGEQNEIRIDLCATALGILSRLQKQLIVTVHRLASHYHWSEKEIFATPHWRRNEYLELIAAGRRL